MAKSKIQKLNNPKILIRKAKYQFIEDLGREVAIIKPKTFFVPDSSKDFHTNQGVISSAELDKKSGEKAKSAIGKDFIVLEPTYLDLYKRIERAAQIIPLKDIGSIITLTGIGRDSTVIDAGAGSGALSLFLAHICKKVTCYEIREDHYELVKRNIEMLKVDNVEIKLGSIYDGADEKDVDVITLDVPEPWETVQTIKDSLKVGGWAVIYNPSIQQISDFIEKIKDDDDFEVREIIEIIERSWDVKGRKIRPKTQGIGHSGFLCFVRRITK